jgi:hypothetical protein
MTLELDHVFVCASAGAPEADRLVALGLLEGSANVHPGQGTANRRFFFRNAMLELLYVSDESEVRSELVAPTRLWERSRYRQTGVSPVGLCLRSTDPGAALPFPTTAYRPPYLPPGTAIPVAEADPAEPMLFVNPFGRRPDASPSDAGQSLEHPIGFGEVTGVSIQLPAADAPSPAWREVERLGFASLVTGADHLLELTFDGAQRGGSADFRPELPLRLRW